MIISMSKCAFISDIHGNYPALCAVLKYCRENKVSSIYCLGDLVGYYSQINEVINTMRDLGIPCIMGNHDYAMAFNNGKIDRSKTCTNVLMRQLNYISPKNLEFIRTLPDQMKINIDGETVWCIHGGINNHIDEYVNVLDDAYFANLPQNVSFVITAHNHKATVLNLNQIKYANSGSVGQPRDHDPRASFVILENHSFDIVRVEYDINKVVEKMRENGFPDYISDVLYTGSRIGE